MLGFLFIIMEVNVINVVMHLFHEPAGLPYRMSFLYSFLLIFMAYRVFITLEAKDLNKLWIVFSAYAVVCLLLYAFNGLTDELAGFEDVCQMFTAVSCILNIAGIFIYAVYLAASGRMSPKQRKRCGVNVVALRAPYS